MERAAVTDAQAERGDLGAINVHARRIRLGQGFYTVAGKQINQAKLDPTDQLAHTKAQPPDIQHQIAHQLPRTMVGHLSAPIGLNYRNIAG